MSRAVLIVIFVLGSACDGTSSKLFFANSLARLSNYQLFEGLTYGPGERQTLDVYRPAGEKGQSVATVIFFYGGCWGYCTNFNKEDYAFVAEALVGQGYVVVVADYRLYPDVGFTEIVTDAAQVVEWAHHHIDDYGGNGRLVLMGHSAGAHLAAMLTLNERYLSVDTYRQLHGFVGLAGPYDFLPFTKAYQRHLFAPESEYPDSQPINFVDGDEPSLLLLYGLSDSNVKPRNHRNLAAKVRQLSGRVEVREYHGVDHSGLLAALSKPLRQRSTVSADIFRFLRHQANRGASE
ncbi:MAG: alpha/beta hydrolase [Pseudomonadales bacterium]